MIYDGILEAVGQTPMVRTKRLLRAHEGELLLKLEGFNPGGSVKDRAALAIILHAEALGQLLPGATIVEATSGNFGKSLAMVGAARGYEVVLVVDPKTPTASLRYCRALGARLEMVEAVDENGSYQHARHERARELVEATPGAFMPDQYDNPLNVEAHRATTAVEILDAVGELDVFVAAVSTGGHISGIGNVLKRARPDAQVVAVDAHGSRLFCDGSAPYAMRGIGLSWRPGNLDLTVIDCVQCVSDAEAFGTCRVVAREEGIAVGESGGAVLFASLAYALAHAPRRIVALIPDGASSYLFDGAYDDGWLGDQGLTADVVVDAGGLREAAANPTFPLLKMNQSS